MEAQKHSCFRPVFLSHWPKQVSLRVASEPHSLPSREGVERLHGKGCRGGDMGRIAGGVNAVYHISIARENWKWVSVMYYVNLVLWKHLLAGDDIIGEKRMPWGEMKICSTDSEAELTSTIYIYEGSNFQSVVWGSRYPWGPFRGPVW